MQIYKGLDIITNKATEEEMEGVRHHLLGFVDPAQSGEGESVYDVTKFVEDTNCIAEGLVGEGKVPIVCGGTTYYCQHLLFPGRLITTPGGGEGEVVEEVDLGVDPVYQKLSEEEKGLLGHVSTGNSAKVDLATRAANDPELGMQLWKLLNKIDPAMAARWHYKDTRKVANSLRVYKETGRPHSVWIAEQDSHQQQQRDEMQGDKVAGGGGMRGVSGYRKLLLWLWCDPPILRKRLDDRVDEMVRRGLEAEVREMRNIAKRMLDDIVSSSAGANYQSGIFQTIGYRQFAEYLDRLEPLSPANITTKQQQQWFDSATQDTKTATRQYAKSQLKWVQNKLIPEVRRAQQAAVAMGGEVELYLLDASNVEQWEEKVRQPALQVLSSFLKREDLPDPATISNPTAANEYLYSGRTANQALSKLQKDGSAQAGVEGEGLRTIQANKMFTCQVCTFDPSHPVLVREVDKETHRKGRHHRNNAKRKMSAEEKEKSIKDKIAQGDRVRALRQQLKHLPKGEEAKSSKQKQN
ncbi:related to tRNA isopentenylpyrophosphate transferase [Ustilago trichophora]|uniref:Related to tRNA isopentenylpyrophosphate transferase n=1 Tax=Ustilago trichophora TaxID=86804 RepID=A0A5C3DS83_9BASI|nr:related to tRNA isopentenylpyrophosphate transferase [Ustilago trichophora]